MLYPLITNFHLDIDSQHEESDDQSTDEATKFVDDDEDRETESSDDGEEKVRLYFANGIAVSEAEELIQSFDSIST